MKRRIILVVLAVVICLGIACPAYAANMRMIDNANLLNLTEIAALSQKLDDASQKLQVDLVIVTTKTTGAKTNTQYADDFFDYEGYGYGKNKDGILLLINMEDSSWKISTSGYGITALTDDAIEYIGNELEAELSRGNYAAAFHTYIHLCDEMVTSARSGNPYKAPFDILSSLLISLVIGFVVAFIATSIMKGQLRSIRSQSAAANYVKEGSFNVSEARDLFLYRSIIRRPRPQNNGGSGTHQSSSGRTHGGGGGHF